MQDLQICCYITLKESYDPDNDEAAPKDVSPNTSLPTRNICTLSVAVLRSVPLFRRHGGPYSGVTPTEHTAVAKGLILCNNQINTFIHSTNYFIVIYTFPLSSIIFYLADSSKYLMSQLPVIMNFQNLTIDD